LGAPFNHTIAIHPKQVHIGKKGLVCEALIYWYRLLVDMCAHPTHVNELIPQATSYIGHTDASGISAGGVLMSIDGFYKNTVWRVEWPEEVSRDVVSDRNPKGSITNSDLEMATILLQWLVLEHVGPTFHRSSLARCDNTPACSWATKMSLRSNIAARLVQALALRQRIFQAAPMCMLHVARKENDILDIPSRSFRHGHRWDCPSNTQFCLVLIKKSLSHREHIGNSSS